MGAMNSFISQLYTHFLPSSFTKFPWKFNSNIYTVRHIINEHGFMRKNTLYVFCRTGLIYVEFTFAGTIFFSQVYSIFSNVENYSEILEYEFHPFRFYALKCFYYNFIEMRKIMDCWNSFSIECWGRARFPIENLVITFFFFYNLKVS